MSTIDSSIARVRTFNRFYTRVIGVLHGKLAGSSYSLIEARLLYELAQSDHEGAELRRTLGLDAGYLSRILSRLSSAGLVRREASRSDGRRQILALTEQGRTAFEDLERRQIASVDELVAPLSPAELESLTGAMATIESVLDERPKPREVVLRSPGPGDLGWVVARNGALYAREQGWGIEYEALVARIIADYAGRAGDPREAGWIAAADGQPVGAIFCMREDERTARLRLLLVDPVARGMGIGERLVDECLRFASRCGYDRITLWTVSTQHAARRIYERAGFTLDDESPFDGFGRPLTGQSWSLALSR